MFFKFNMRRYLLLVFIFLLISCSLLSTDATSDKVSPVSITDVNSTAVSVAYTLIAQTMAAVPTSTVMPTATVLPPAPTQIPLPFMELEGLRVVYITGAGDLYVQDSGRQSVRLAQGVKDVDNRPPLISDDGQKIVFYRAGESDFDAVYMINADGRREQILITRELLSAFGNVYDELTVMVSIAFVPGTHLLLFNTYQPHNYDPESLGWLPLAGNDLFVVDTDTGNIKQLKAPWQGGNYLAAPNGKWIAVQTLDHIDIIDVGGMFVKRNLVKYDKVEAHVIVPMTWVQDSTELIILPSEIPLFAGGLTIDRTIWCYSINSGTGTEIKLTPPPVYDAYAVSPDGNWIAYFYASGNSINLDKNIPFGLYLGNLQNGSSQLLYARPNDLTGQVYDWSPDNVYFVFSDQADQIYMGNIYGKITRFGQGGGILGWADNTHYVLSNGVVGDVNKIETFDEFIYYFPVAFAYLK